MSFEVKEYKHSGGEITKYAVFGTGEKVFVMVPGLSIKPVTLSAELIDEGFKMFFEDYTLYLFDRPYPVHEGVTVNELSEKLYEVLCELGITGAYFFGASQGGMILQSLMVNHPRAVKKAVIGSSTGRVGIAAKNKIGEWMRLAKEGDVRALHLKFFDDVYSKETLALFEGNIDSLIPDCTKEELQSFYNLSGACEGFDILKQLESVKIPTLVMGSECDVLMSASEQELLAKALHGKIYMYTGFSHAVYDEAPDYRQRIFDFFSE